MAKALRVAVSLFALARASPCWPMRVMTWAWLSTLDVLAAYQVSAWMARESSSVSAGWRRPGCRRVRQPFQTTDLVGSQVEADHPPIIVQQRLLVEQDLGHPEQAKGHPRLGFAHLVRDGSVAERVGCELDEQAIASVALVQLASGVEESWSIADRRCKFSCVADPRAQGQQRRVGQRRGFIFGQLARLAVGGAGLQQGGTIDSFESVLLAGHGGDLNGLFLIRGEPDKLYALMAAEEWATH